MSDANLGGAAAGGLFGGLYDGLRQKLRGIFRGIFQDRLQESAWVESERDSGVPLFVALFCVSALTYYVLPFEPYFWLIAAVLLLAGVFVYYLRASAGRILAFGVLALCLGGSYAQLRAWVALEAAPILEAETLTSVLQVQNMEDRGNGSYVVDASSTLHVDDAVARKIKLYIYRNSLGCGKPSVGAVYRWRFNIRPFYSPAYFGSYDFARASRLLGFAGQGSVEECIATILPAKEARSGIAVKFWAAVDGARQTVRARLSKHLEGDILRFAGTITTADKRITDKQRRRWQLAGLSHLLAISGLHIGVVGMFVFVVIRMISLVTLGRATAIRPEWPPVLAGTLAALFYLFLSGFHTSATRAMLMLGFIFLSFVLHREAFSVRVVALAAAIMLLVEPSIILRPGFVLSFMAVTALIASYRKGFFLSTRMGGDGFADDTGLAKIARGMKRVVLFFLDTGMASVIASLVTMPVVIYQFGTASLVAVLANLIAVPIFVSAILPSLTLALALMPLGLEAYPMLIAERGLGFIDQVAGFLGELPLASVTLARPDGLWVALFYVGALLFLLLHGIRAKAGLGAMLCATVLMFTVSDKAISRPDVILSAQGPLVALNSDDGYRVNSVRISSFERKDWLSALGYSKKAGRWGKGFGSGDSEYQLDCANRGICYYRAGLSSLAIVFLYDPKFCPQKHFTVFLHVANARMIPCLEGTYISVEQLAKQGTTVLSRDAAAASRVPSESMWQQRYVEENRKNRAWWVEQPLTKFHYSRRR